MSFIDEIKIYAEAGKGGNGVVRWRQEKFIPKGGPAGGDGGRGGDFYVQAVRDIHILSKYKAKKSFITEKGEDGGNKSLHGKKGDDFVLDLPLGSAITNLETDEKWQLLEEGQRILLLKGGYGGYGNEHFKSSTNTTPKEWRPGEVGEYADFLIELELFADIGLVGLPNAGKSSLLNAMTNADAKVGDYAFTTLDPNLGNFYGYTIADIPGLIEGANTGKGLGVKFLRHIKRTKMIAHLVSFESFPKRPVLEEERSDGKRSGLKRNDKMIANYKAVRKELEKYDKNLDLGVEGLFKKDEIIVLTKSDTVEDSKIIEKKKKEFEKLVSTKKGVVGKKVFVLSLYDDKSIKDFRDSLVKILQKK